jgi:septal ring factor EnvC (AmiA/AmiB activator)
MWMGNRCSETRLAIALACLIGLLPVRQVPAAAPAAQEQLNVTREQLQAMETEIRALRTEAQRLGKQANSIMALLDRYDTELRLKGHEIQLLTLRQRKTEQDIRDLRNSFDNMERSLAEQRAYLSRRLVEAYKLGRLNYWRLILEARSGADLLRTYQYVTFLARDDRRRVDEYRRSIREMDQARTRLEQENRTLTLLRRDLEEANRELAHDRQEKVRLLASIQNEKEMHLNTLSELRSAAAQLQSLFVNRDLAPVPGADAAPSMVRFKGSLDWPVHGRVVRTFGLERNSRFGTTTVCNGVEISAQEGAAVTAVFEGQVVFAEWFKGYGKSIIVFHPGGYYTLYAHNSELLVQRGDAVQKGQLIARVGSTGSLTGTCLYFEVRDKDKPLDPLQWLRKRS